MARRAALVLPLLALTQFLMTLDTSVMNVSIATLVEDLDTTVVAIQGVITAYTLVMAAGMISGGRIGDVIGRRNALRLGLLVYAAGSLVTALAPNVLVLLLGWSVLEGLGAALIMPTVTALIAGNVAEDRRPAAYGAIAAAAAAAVAVGPIVGGAVTAYLSWRYVFAAEVVVALLIVVGSRALADERVEARPGFDALGALLSAAGLALVVFAVLQSGAWGWVLPRVDAGPDATPVIAGTSPVLWLLVTGGLVLWGFALWERRRAERGRMPLVHVELLRNRRLATGLGVLLLQNLVMMGMFFAMPLFLSVVLGLDAFQTGLRLLPLSIALVVVAPLAPRILRGASPRRIVQAGLLLILVAVLVMASRLLPGVDASATALPFVLIGAGLGLIASQLGAVIVSAVDQRQAGEVGALQYTAQNLGSSLGTALVGAVVIGALGTLLLQGISRSPELDDALKRQAAVTLSGDVPFASDAEVDAALARTSLSAAEQRAISQANAEARLGALRKGMAVLSVFVLLALLLSTRLPAVPLGGAAPARGP